MRMLFRPFAASVLLLASSCAIQVPPSGGDKDITPPALLKASPENFSTQFTGKEIVLHFDEYINLKDLASQFVVSPPLKHTPDIKVSKKNLHITLEDTLAGNTTYTMNFGNAITDIHEGNPLENFQYVFSTGNELDSLIVSGKVENALDKKTEKGIFVMLYRNSDDSMPVKSLPDYFSKTKDNGTFEIRNVAAGSYRIFALKDNNSNYLFDNQEEPVAFSEETINAGDGNIPLELFTEKKKQQLLRASCEEPGRVSIAYARPLENEAIQFMSDTASLKIHTIRYSETHDTILIWYRNQLSDSLNFVINYNGGSDTIQVRLKQLDAKGKLKTYVTLTSQFLQGTENTLALKQPLQLNFNHPIANYKAEDIAVTEDSIPLKDIRIYFLDSLKTKLTFEFPKKENSRYTVLIPKGALEDIFGNQNDSLKYLFRTKSTADFGTVEIKFSGSVPGRKYILQLIDEKEVIFRQSHVSSDTSVFYDFLDPRNYRLKLIEDLNDNAEWDTGNYLLHQQPERVFYYAETLTVRANWDVEVKWEIKNEELKIIR